MPEEDPGIQIQNERSRMQAIISELKGLEMSLAIVTDTKSHHELQKQFRAKVNEFEKIFSDFYEVVKKGYAQNTKLIAALAEARQQMVLMQEEIDKLSAPPLSYGVYLSANEDGTVNVSVHGRKVKVNLHPSIKQDMLKPGQEVILNEGMNVIAVAGFEKQGEAVSVKEILDDERLLVACRANEDRVCFIAEPLKGTNIRVGDHLMMDLKTGYVYEKLPKSEVEDLLLEEVPNISYKDIGGLSQQIRTIQENIELPFTPAGRGQYAKMELTAPKGVILFGPPGCGKTLIAKAIARSLADRISREVGESVKGFFINIKGPEILNKYVGESERKIREIYLKAREKASAKSPVIVFIDEADSVLRARGAGISSDVEITIVPQFLAELDGVESLENVITILASNRQDLIDPAVLRPGRVDIKIRVDRPDKRGAAEIFAIYIKPTLPLHPKYFDEKHHQFSEMYRGFGGDPKLVINHMIEQATRRLWASKEEPYEYGPSGKRTIADNRIIEFLTEKGDIIIYLKDVASGAMIKSIVDRAKKNAIRRALNGQEEGLLTADFCLAVEQEMHENEELPNTEADVQRWLDIQGRRERVVRVKRSFVDQRKEKGEKEVVVEGVANTGQYL
ncbi:MAG: proteasome ATPase [bacterium]|nr:proteasome ATPase [bacterium]